MTQIGIGKGRRRRRWRTLRKPRSPGVVSVPLANWSISTRRRARSSDGPACCSIRQLGRALRACRGYLSLSPRSPLSQRPHARRDFRRNHSIQHRTSLPPDFLAFRQIISPSDCRPADRKQQEVFKSRHRDQPIPLFRSLQHRSWSKPWRSDDGDQGPLGAARRLRATSSQPSAAGAGTCANFATPCVVASERCAYEGIVHRRAKRRYFRARFRVSFPPTLSAVVQQDDVSGPDRAHSVQFLNSFTQNPKATRHANRSQRTCRRNPSLGCPVGGTITAAPLSSASGPRNRGRCACVGKCRGILGSQVGADETACPQSSQRAVGKPLFDGKGRRCVQHPVGEAPPLRTSAIFTSVPPEPGEQGIDDELAGLVEVRRHQRSAVIRDAFQALSDACCRLVNSHDVAFSRRSKYTRRR